MRRASGRRPVDAGFRPDLEGLRGLAIVLVLFCHAGIPGAEAGFVGVDIFFVLSGFLITGLLVEEGERTGRISFGAFYARRARRILPMAIVVLASTLLAAQLVLSPLDLQRVADDTIAASLSLANVRFALDATDYFAPVGASPVLHYWSLGVEEQFYLLWPVLLAVAARARRLRVAMTLVVTVVLAASFLLCIAITASNGPLAYYSLPTRAWQLAAGGLLALAAPWFGRASRPVGSLVGWVGVGLVGASLALIGPTTEYPGLASVLPTLGALAIIASGGAAGSPGSIALVTAPLRWLGRVSYSLYLWHWPLLVLGPVAVGLASSEDGLVPGDMPVRLGLIVLAVVMAALSWRLVEEPFRRHRLSLGGMSLGGRVRGVALAGAAVLAIGVGSTTMGAVAQRDIEAISAFDRETDPVPATVPVSLPLPAPSPARASAPASQPVSNTFPVASPSSTSSPANTPAARPTPRIDGRVPRDLSPSLHASRDDDDPLLADGCGLSLAGSRPPRCVYGQRDGAVTVALVGDSHASQWFPALEIVARQRGWRLVPFTKFSCVFVDMRISSPLLRREYTECEDWRENVVDSLVKLKPDLVVVASNRWFPVLAKRDNEPERQGAAMARLIKRIPGTVAILVDTPRSDFDVPACLAMHIDAIDRCTTTRSAAFGWRHLRREAEASRLTGATIVDLSDAVCPTDPCPPIIGETLVYFDHHHLTATFAISLAPELEAALPAPAAQIAVGPAAPSPPAPASPTIGPSPPPPSPSIALPSVVPVRPAGAFGLRAEVHIVAAGETAVSPVPKSPEDRSWEPVVATHPTDPNRIAVIYQHRGPGAACRLNPVIRISHDGGLSWRSTRSSPAAGSGRGVSLHAAIAWGPGPSGTSRLYWANMTVPSCNDGRFSLSTAYSDDEGATWSKLRVERGTPPWVGGVPEIAVDRDPASPNFGTVYVGYNWLERGARGPGFHILASADFGRTWTSTEIPPAPGPRGYGDWWRIGYRLRPAPDGAVYASWYQVDLRRWDRSQIFAKGGPRNVGRLGVAVARVVFNPAEKTFAVGRSRIATTVPETAFTTSGASAPGTTGNIRPDPMWLHGFDVDPATGRLYLAVAAYGLPIDGAPRGSIRVGRSDDAGETWSFSRLRTATAVGNRQQSSIRPNLVAGRGYVLVTMHTLDDSGSAATVGSAFTYSTDGGASWRATVPVSGERWRASNLGGVVNATGLRERAERLVDGDVFWAYGDGRHATRSRPGMVTIVGALLRVGRADTCLRAAVLGERPWCRTD